MSLFIRPFVEYALTHILPLRNWTTSTTRRPARESGHKMAGRHLSSSIVGRAFDFLSWCRPLTISAATPQKPTLAALQSGEVLWRLAHGGTCSALHFKRLELEKLGTLRVDKEKLRRS